MVKADLKRWFWGIQADPLHHWRSSRCDPGHHDSPALQENTKHDLTKSRYSCFIYGVESEPRLVMCERNTPSMSVCSTSTNWASEGRDDRWGADRKLGPRRVQRWVDTHTHTVTHWTTRLRAQEENGSLTVILPMLPLKLAPVKPEMGPLNWHDHVYEPRSAPFSCDVNTHTSFLSKKYINTQKNNNTKL